MGAQAGHPVGSQRVNARDYYSRLQDAVRAAPHVLRSEIRFDEIDEDECYISGVLLLIGDLELHIAEYVITAPDLLRLKYRYHLQTADGVLLSRWDNAPHHREISGFPDHRHNGDATVYPTVPMDLPGVLNAALVLALPANPEDEQPS